MLFNINNSIYKVSLMVLAILLVFSCKDKEEEEMNLVCDPSTISCPNFVVDEKDGQSYKVIKIGCQCWTAENVNYAEAGLCYDNVEENCAVYGRLYTWEEVLHGEEFVDNLTPIKGICPKGWHIPTVWEWRTLVDSLGGFEMAGAKMKADSIWNPIVPDTIKKSGFDALPAGSFKFSSFSLLGVTTKFFSATQTEEGSIWTLDLSLNIIESNIRPKAVVGRDINYSCRCIKD